MLVSYRFSGVGPALFGGVGPALFGSSGSATPEPYECKSNTGFKGRRVSPSLDTLRRTRTRLHLRPLGAVLTDGPSPPSVPPAPQVRPRRRPSLHLRRPLGAEHLDVPEP
jgi:hypothetical protein